MTYANAKNFFQNTALSNLFFAAGGSLLTYLPLRGVHPWCTSNNGTRLARRMLFVELRTRHKPWRAEWKGRLLLPTLLLFFLSIYIRDTTPPLPTCVYPPSFSPPSPSVLSLSNNYLDLISISRYCEQCHNTSTTI